MNKFLIKVAVSQDWAGFDATVAENVGGRFPQDPRYSNLINEHGDLLTQSKKERYAMGGLALGGGLGKVLSSKFSNIKNPRSVVGGLALGGAVVGGMLGERSAFNKIHEDTLTRHSLGLDTLTKEALNRYESHMVDKSGTMPGVDFTKKYGHEGALLKSVRQNLAKSKDIIGKVKGEIDPYKLASNKSLREVRYLRKVIGK